MAKAINEGMVQLRVWKEGAVVKASYDGEVADDAAPDYKHNPHRNLPDDQAAMVAAFAAVIADITTEDL